MKTLVIHPKDKSTDFLIPIYKSIMDKKVLRGGDFTKEELREEIKNHDRIIMLGHGSPSGLLNTGSFTRCGGFFVIDQSMVGVLKNKEQNVFIWCNSDQFVKRHNLKGFFSGMFISEVVEGVFHSINCEQKEVDESNNKFSKIMSKVINEDKSVIHKVVKKRYSKLKNPVSQYNCVRLFVE